jgi:hypothetical protein
MYRILLYLGGCCALDMNYLKCLSCLVIAGFTIILLNVSFSQVFTDMQAIKGIDHLNATQDRWGCSVSFFDFDDDGWDDLTFAMEDDSLMIYKNVQGDFVKLPAPFFLQGKTKHVLWVDYDNDGDYDLAVTTYDGIYRLYNNNGNFEFTDVTIAAGMNPLPGRTYGITFGDYNRDGFLDAYVALYEVGHSASNLSKLNQLYKNNGDGTFSNVTISAGVGDSIQTTFQAAWIDADNDGWQDLFVINDRFLFKNSLYKNNGDETFTDFASQANVRMPTEDPMSTTIGDFDNDGFLDIYITNTGTPNTPQRLFKNNGDGTFSDVASSLGVNPSSWNWGSIWLDYDNDGWQDLFVAEGSPTQSDNVKNYFYRNNHGSFADSSQLLLNAQAATSTAAAKGDFNNDGFYDIVVRNEAPFFTELWQNSGNSNNYIKITLQGTSSNRMAIGSYIRVYADGQESTDYILCGENYVAQNSQHRIFGLGTLSTVDSVSVTYLSGHTDWYYDLPANTHYYFLEGETLIVNLVAPEVSFCAGDSVLVSLSKPVQEVVWSNGNTSFSQYIKESNPIYATGINLQGIEFLTDTLLITEFLTPQYSVQVSPIQCYDLLGGTIFVESIESNGISWSNGSTDWIIEDLSAGSYQFTLFYGQNCQLNDQIELISPSELVVFYDTQNMELGGDGYLNVIAFGGTPPYSYFMNGTPFQPPLSNLNAGEYSIIVEDQNGCSITQTIVIGSAGLSEGAHSLLPQLYPNPSSDGAFYITNLNPNSSYSIQIRDSKGSQRFYEKEFTNKNQHHININLSQGVYVVEVLNLTSMKTIHYKWIVLN